MTKVVLILIGGTSSEASGSDVEIIRTNDPHAIKPSDVIPPRQENQ